MKNVKIENINGSPAVVINGEVYPPMFMTIATTDIASGKLKLDREYFKRLGESGIKIFFPITDTEWGRPGALEQFKELAEFILDAVPDAYFIVRIGLHAPNEWVEANPDECFTYDDGSKPAVLLASESYHANYTHQYSMASQKWRERAGEALIETCKAHDALPFADRIIGYFFAAGGTSEWYYMMFMEEGERYGDFSKAFQREFSAYLKEKYGDDETLKKAWRDDRASIENPIIYGLKERYFADRVVADVESQPAPECGLLKETIVEDMDGPNIGYFLNTDKYLGISDLYQAWNRTIADSQIYFGNLVKKYYNGDILTGGFYGSYGWTIYAGGCTVGSVLRILDSNALDFLAAPGDYNNRNPGGFAGQREIQDSFRLRGKIFVVEEDSRTHVEPPYYRTLFDCFDIIDSVNTLKRDFGRNLSEDIYSWWFDQIMGGGRYKFEEIYALFERQQEVARYAYTLDRNKGNEIALIFDEESLCSVANGTTRTMLQYFRDYEVAKIGAGVDYYFHNDLARENMPDYKLYVFFNTFELTAKEREEITAKLQKNGATALWLYAPGVIDVGEDNRFNPAHIQALTGFNVSILNAPTDMKFRLNGEENELTQGLEKRKIFGCVNQTDKCNIIRNGSWLPRVSYAFPYFYPNDEKATLLGYNCMTGLPALAVKEYNGFTSVYHSSQIVNHDVVRSVAEAAGCHIYSYGSDVVYASDNFITIHASSSGVKKLYFKERCSPFEVYEKRYYGNDVKELEIEMQTGDTLTFCVKNAKEF